MRRLLDGLFTAVALVFIIPTFLVLISWNALPGESLYPLKTGLENITLIMLSGTPLVPKASMKFTDTRFNEATVLLSKKGSSVGYSLLVAQAQTTQNYLVTKKDTADSATFVQSINTYQAQIEQTKRQVVAQAQATGTLPQNYVVPTPIPTIAPTSAPAVIPTVAPVQPEVTSPPSAGQQITVTQSQTIVVQQESPQQILQNLNNAESQLQNIKQEVQKQSGGDHGQGQGKGQDQGQQGGQGQGDQSQGQGQGH